MNDMTRRQALLAAATGAAATGIVAAGGGQPHAQGRQSRAAAPDDGQVTIDVQELNQAFEEFGKATERPTDNVCETYKKIRPTLETIISGLKLIGVFLPVAKQAAEVMEKLRDWLDVLCP